MRLSKGEVFDTVLKAGKEDSSDDSDVDAEAEQLSKNVDLNILRAHMEQRKTIEERKKLEQPQRKRIVSDGKYKRDLKLLMTPEEKAKRDLKK